MVAAGARVAAGVLQAHNLSLARSAQSTSGGERKSQLAARSVFACLTVRRGSLVATAAVMRMRGRSQPASA